MIIKKLETRQQWLCVVNEIQYVRTQIHWNNDIQDDVTWHLNKDYVQEEIYLNEEELEELFKNKEVMKKEQTIKEVAERLYPYEVGDIVFYKNCEIDIQRQRFIEGVKWKQQQAKMIESEQKVYSYDDLMEAFVMGRLGETIKKFNGKFKNK